MYTGAMQNTTEKEDHHLIHNQNWIIRFIINREDNIRFFLLGVFINLYMVIGAAVFQGLEEENEKEAKREFSREFSNSMNELRKGIEDKNITVSQVEQLLYLWGNATEEGVNKPQVRWNYGGAFYFVFTVVSTLGKT